MKDLYNHTTFLKGARNFYLGMCRADRSLSPPVGPAEPLVNGDYRALLHLDDDSTLVIDATPIVTWRYKVASNPPKHPGAAAPKITTHDKARAAATYLAELAERAIAAAQTEASR
jgi:hypothetical protein